MNLCVITFGPLRSNSNGYLIRVWNLVKEASRYYDSVVVLEFPEGHIHYKQRDENIEFVTLRGSEIISNRFACALKRIITYDPLHNLRFQLVSFIELWKCRTRISRGDIILVEGALIPAGVLLAKLLGKKVMLDTHGMNKLLATRFKKVKWLAYFLRILFWDILERFALRLSDIVIVVSAKEKSFAVDSYGIAESKVFVVPNALNQMKPTPSYDAAQSLRKKLGLQNRIVATFIGDLQIVQNADAVDFIVRELAPSLWKTRKDVAFLLVGKTDGRFRDYSPNVIFTGFVDDLNSYIKMSDICIAPLRVGCGVKTKLLQYLAYGKPIVTTPIGVEGIATEGLKAIMVADIYAFEKTLLATLDNLDELRQQSKQNKRIFERKFSMQSFDESFRKCLDYVTP